MSNEEPASPNVRKKVDRIFMGQTVRKQPIKRGKQKRRGQRPVIPQGKRIERRLGELENAMIEFFEVRRRLYDPPHVNHDGVDLGTFLSQNYGQNAWSNVERHYEALQRCTDIAVKLVHLDNNQIYHPFVQYLLNAKRGRDFLKRLHRGLEKGVKQGIGSLKGILGRTEEERYSNAISVLNIVRKDRQMFAWDSEPPKSFTEIQQYLEKEIFDTKGKVVRGPLIKKMSRQNFHKTVKRLFYLLDTDSFWNKDALPRRPKKKHPSWHYAETKIKEMINVEENYRK